MQKIIDIGNREDMSENTENKTFEGEQYATVVYISREDIEEDNTFTHMGSIVTDEG